MIPITLVTGFLGSGKTTFLQRVVSRHRGRHLLYLVNEFSPVDIDGHLLDVPPDRLVTLPGGSIFCQCLVTDFVTHLRAIAARPAHTIEGVVIEASGIADPRVVSRMLAETRLAEHLRLATVIAIIDPDNFESLLQTLPNIRAQVEAASLAIINKVDLHADDTLGAVDTRLRAINPRLAIHRATHCDVRLDLFAPAPPAEATGDYAPCADPNYARLTITPARELTLEELQGTLSPLEKTVYRLKGFARVDGRVHHIDLTTTSLSIQPTDRPDVPLQLVCVFPPTALDRVRTVRAVLEGE